MPETLSGRTLRDDLSLPQSGLMGVPRTTFPEAFGRGDCRVGLCILCNHLVSEALKHLKHRADILLLHPSLTKGLLKHKGHGVKRVVCDVEVTVRVSHSTAGVEC